MKTIQFSTTGGPEVLAPTEIEQPTPGPGQVLIKIAAIGVNYGDVNVRRGDVPPPPLPATPGLEYSGTIAAVGPGVTTFGVGQRVVGQAYLKVFELAHVGGAYAEYAVAHTDYVAPIPDDMDFATAAAFFANYLAAYFLLHVSAHAERGETVLLYGAAGGIGSAVLQLARHAGVDVIALVSNNERAAYAKEQGATHVIQYRREDVSARVRQITNGRGVDYIFNSAGGDTLARDYDLLAPVGLLIWYGFAAGPPQADLTALITDFANFTAGKGVRTSSLPSYAHKPGLWQRATEELIKLWQRGAITPNIAGQLPLDEAASAHARLESSGVLGKLLLIP